MNAGWQAKTLDQISENLDSRRIPITKTVRNSGEYPYYGASGIVDYVAEYIFDLPKSLVLITTTKSFCCLTQSRHFLMVFVSRSLSMNSEFATRTTDEEILRMTFPHRTGSWRWLFRACLMGLLLVASAKSGFAQARASVPSAERQKEVAKLLEDTYNLRRLETVPKKQDAVKKLMESSRNKNLAADERYVVLVTVIPLTKEIGDFASWLEAVNALVGAFEVDANKEKTRLLTEFLEASKPGTSLKPAAVEEALAIVRVAAKENRYADANSLLKVVETTVQRATGANSLNKVVAETRDKITAREKDWKAFQTASTKLGSNADDPAANFTVGRWHLLQQADWKTALPFLAKASDAKWKAAAELEHAAPLDAMAQAAVGDAWWEIAQTEPGATKTALLVHAGEWYARAQPNLTSALKKQLVTKRLDEIAPLKGAVAVKPVAPVNPGPNPPVVPAAPPAKPGEWIDLLEWAEGIDWVPRGINWNNNIEGTPTKNGIALKRGWPMRFPLPALIDGTYELDVEFTRHQGAEGVEVFFPVGTHPMRFMIGSNTGTLAYVAHVDGKVFSEIRPAPISNNQRHRVFIRVRHDGDKAGFNIDWDNVKDYIKWEGAPAALWGGDTLTMLRHPWIGSWNSNCEFHKVRVRMLSGTIQRDVITVADREQDLKNGFVRLIGEKASVTKVGWAQFLVNQIPVESGPGNTERWWPLITRDFKVCDDFYGAHAPSRLKCPIPSGAKSFSAVGYNDSSRTAKYLVSIDGKQVYDSGVTDIAIIKQDIPAKSTLQELVIDPSGDHFNDQTYWCHPQFHSVAADKVTDKMLEGKSGTLKFKIASSSVGAATLTRNQAIGMGPSIPIHFRDAQPCDEFLFAHAPSTVTYQVPEKMTRFTAIGYNTQSRHVKYEVWADAKRMYESAQAGIVPIDVKLPPGTKTIELKINDLGDSGNDRCMWCYPRLHRK